MKLQVLTTLHSIHTMANFIAFAEENDIDTIPIDDPELLVCNLKCSNGIWRTLIYVCNEFKMVELRSYAPFTLNDEQKMNVTELVNRINVQNTYGCYTVDYAEGDVCLSLIHI